MGIYFGKQSFKQKVNVTLLNLIHNVQEGDVKLIVQ